MAKHRKPPPKKFVKELDKEESELFLNAFYQGGFLAHDTTKPEPVEEELKPRIERIDDDDRDLFLRAMGESDLCIPKKDRNPLSTTFKEPKRSRKKELVDGSIDLHGMFAEDAVKALFRFLDQEKRRGSRTLLIVHGKGSGVLKNTVWSCLNNHPHVCDFQIAPGKLGGAGALLVRIKRKMRE